MGYDSAVVAGRYGYAIQHTERPGFRAVGAFAETPDGEQLVGFGYGYLDRARPVVARPGPRRPRPADGEALAARRVRGLRAARPPRPPEPRPGPPAAARPARRPAAAGGPALHARRRHEGLPALPRRRLRRPGPRLPLPRRRRGPSPSSAPSCRCIRRAGPGEQLSVRSSAADGSVDVVVVGSGHNGLVAACYLARAGLSVEVVESDDVLGGAVSTVERWPGVRVDRGSSAHVIIRHSGIVEELDLAAHGLRYVDCDPWGSRPRRPRAIPAPTAARWSSPSTSTPPAPPSRPPAARRTPPPTAGSSRCGARAAARSSPSFGRRPERRPAWSAPSGRWARPPTGGRAPPAASSPSTSSAPATRCSTAGSPASGSRRRWPGSAPSPARRCPSPARRPWSAGSALLHDVPPGHPVGGSGGLTAALRRRLEADGGRVVLGDGAARLLVEDDGAGPRVTGVETVVGTADRAPAPSSPPATSGRPGELAGDAAPPALADADPPLGNGFGLVVRALTDAPAALSRRPPRAQSLQGLQLLCTDRAELAAAHGDWRRRPAAARPGAAGHVLLGERRHPRPARAARRHDLGPVVPVRARRRRRLGRARRRRGAAAGRRRRPLRARASPTRYSDCTYRRRSRWSANCPCPVATSCTWRWGWPACSASGRRRRCPATGCPGLRGPLPGRRLHPPRRRGVGQLRAHGGARAARRPPPARRARVAAARVCAGPSARRRGGA